MSEFKQWLNYSYKLGAHPLWAQQWGDLRVETVKFGVEESDRQELVCPNGRERERDMEDSCISCFSRASQAAAFKQDGWFNVNWEMMGRGRKKKTPPRAEDVLPNLEITGVSWTKTNRKFFRDQREKLESHRPHTNNLNRLNLASFDSVQGSFTLWPKSREGLWWICFLKLIVFLDALERGGATQWCV